MQQRNKTLIVLLSGIVVLVILVGAYVFKVTPMPSSGTTATSSTESTTTQSAGGASVTGTGSFTLREQDIPVPSLDAPIVFSSSVTSDQRVSLNAQLASTQSSLKSAPQDYESLLELALLHEEGGDYTAAETIWNYVSALYPQNVVSHADLADLYANYLHDYSAAAEEYKAQIANDPSDLDVYVDLFDLYTQQYPQGSSAPASVLEQGIGVNPQAVNLYVILARYYAGKGDTADAKVQYKSAIQIAQGQNNTELVSQLQAEEAALH